MNSRKNILVINGSASLNSSNRKLIDVLVKMGVDLNFTIFSDLKTLPHFDPERSIEGTPQLILNVRKKIENADGIIICTPEYVFSIPSGLKNLIEWCVSTTIFENKPSGLITASANGEKGHEELQLLMRTVSARFDPGTTLLIRGIKGKFDEKGEIEKTTEQSLAKFMEAFRSIVSI